MTITLTPSQPTDTIGPGLQFKLSTDNLSFPFPGTWSIEVFTHAAPTVQGWTETFTAVGNDQYVRLGTEQNLNTVSGPDHIDIPDDVSVDVHILLNDNAFTTFDNGTITTQWNARDGLATLQALAYTNSTSAGLTPTQATQLENSSDNSDTNLSLWDTFTSVTLPSLNDLIDSIITGITTTLHTATGDVPTTIGTFFEQWERSTLGQAELTDGPTCESFDADISHGTYFSILLVITSYPSDWFFGGPGGTWGPMDLAVLRVQRSGNEVFRTGIHTTSYTLAPPPDVVIGPETFGQPVTPLEYHVLVDPAPGVCFQLYVEQLP